MVEGIDDEHVVKHICRQHYLGHIEVIQPYGGKDDLIESIGVRVKESDIAALGIIIDADTDLSARWAAVSGRLTQSGYTSVPTNPDPLGTILTPPQGSILPKVGIWLMPNNQLPGILEDFLAFLVPVGDTLFPYATEVVNTIPPPPKFSATLRSKALMHTWLAWQADPGRPFGTAITARYLDPHLPAANVFAGWLTRTFFETQ